MSTETKPLKMTKVQGYLVEPILAGHNRSWEGHHTTNPCSIRLSQDPRVFLGYRAGGDDDHYYWHDREVWGSALGMAILDERGEHVTHRLPLPIIKLERSLALPQSEAEFDRYVQEHSDEVVVLHDFRLFEHQGYLYVIYHEGSVTHACDCIVRMKVSDFLLKIEQSLALMRFPPADIIERWRTLWWQPDTWEPAGVNGTRLIYGSKADKNDIVFCELADGTLLMCHRPLPDIAVLPTGQMTCANATPDGIAAFGSLETCIRPGYFDNSHIGNNGTPIRARIGNVDVYIDVVHGVHNPHIAAEGNDDLLCLYLPYFRVRDAVTGELLYYSEAPILDRDEIWREYVEDGAWVSINPHLIGVMFPGGVVELERGKNALDDLFNCYIGVGDTAVARATFRLRDLLPDAVIADILVRRQHQQVQVPGIPSNEWHFPGAISGWEWSIANEVEARRIRILRRLRRRDGEVETGTRTINTVPGRFDADGLLFDGRSVRYLDGIGWAVLYTGMRWDETDGQKVTTLGYGALLLDEANPERLLYRSTEPLNGWRWQEQGWTVAWPQEEAAVLLARMETLIPRQVLFEIRRAKHLTSIGKNWASNMTRWLLEKSRHAAGS